jgi:hypothetical protein
MSYILDALKKIEREKIKKSASGGVMTLSGDLFHERPPKQNARSAGKIVILIVMVSLVTFAVSWFLLKGDRKQAVVVKSVPVPAVPSATPPPSAAAAPPSQPQPAAPLPIAPPPATPQPNTTTAVTSPLLSAATSVAPVDNEKPARKKRKLSPSAEGTVRSLPTVPAPADIRLSGIAWQDERNSRRAVINDFLLHEGSVVAGAKVSEILADRVRFSTATGVFEVRLNAAQPQPVEQKR